MTKDTKPDDAKSTPSEIDPRIAELTGERDKLAEDLKTLQEAAVTPDPRIAELETENADLKKQLEKASVDIKAAKASKAPKPPKARKIGAVEDGLKGRDLLDAIAAAETVELVFSDGSKEIDGIDPMTISGDAWAMSADQVKMNVPELLVHGPAVNRPPFSLAGYGLLLDGKLAAYAPRSETLTIGGGGQVNLTDDVIF